MNHNLRILVVDPVKGKTTVRILNDAAAADEAFQEESEKPANESVRLFIYPQPQRVRYPANDAVMIAENKKRIERETADRANAALRKAEAEREEAKAAFEKADEAHKALLPAEVVETK